MQLDITEEEKKKVEAVARSIDETREKLGEVGVKEAFGDPEAYNRSGIFYTEIKEWEKAKEYFGKALEIDPKFALAWNNLGVAYDELGDHTQAEQCYRKAKDLGP